ncbi:LYR motif-containing protein 4 [Anopheles arabiensis]|uniref:Complex 1 LYR protein domain-containing protein n=1 Tax=Anopheles arabiensis TaxID=7173 RepID=A0A182I7Q1_ANOAR|nr:LYR motif-containing protein 4 [Anopheles arabiensis]XP_040229033.1 LYR motif-containing protein 4 [Anopheles coluzzii]
MAGAGHKMKVLSLYKQLLRASQKFDSYNYRMYALRRIRDAFRENRALTDNAAIASELSYAQKNLEIIKRQTVIGQLYGAPDKLVIEK